MVRRQARSRPSLPHDEFPGDTAWRNPVAVERAADGDHLEVQHCRRRNWSGSSTSETPAKPRPSLPLRDPRHRCHEGLARQDCPGPFGSHATGQHGDGRGTGKTRCNSTSSGDPRAFGCDGQGRWCHAREAQCFGRGRMECRCLERLIMRHCGRGGISLLRRDPIHPRPHRGHWRRRKRRGLRRSGDPRFWHSGTPTELRRPFRSFWRRP